jgi:hypothetical protein
MVDETEERGVSRVSFSEEALSRDANGDGSFVVVREERGTFLGPLMGRITVSHPPSCDARADARPSSAASSSSSSSSSRPRRKMLAYAPNDEDDDDDRGATAGSPRHVRAEYDNLVVNMGLLKCGNRYRASVPVPDYWTEEMEEEVEEEVVDDGHGGKNATSVSRRDASSSPSSHSSLDELVEVRIAEESIDSDLEGEIGRDEDDDDDDEEKENGDGDDVRTTVKSRRPRRRRGSVLSISLLAKQQGPYRGRFLLELIRYSKRRMDEEATESMANESHDIGVIRSSSSSSSSSMQVITGRCLMSVLVEATIMGKDTGTPKLRNGVICLGKLVGYDSDDETEWRGFDD